MITLQSFDQIPYEANQPCGWTVPDFRQPVPNNGTIALQMVWSSEDFDPVLRAYDQVTGALIESFVPDAIGNNFKWQIDLADHTDMHNRCIIFKVLGQATDSGQGTSQVVITQSEPVAISDGHTCLKKITYSNNEEFDGCIFVHGYKTYEHIRYIPAIMEANAFPETNTVYLQSNGVTRKLSARIKSQYNFTTDYLPPYMHEGNVLAFAHDQVEIDGANFVKEQDYSFERIERYALAKGNTTLSRGLYNYVNSNC